MRARPYERFAKTEGFAYLEGVQYSFTIVGLVHGDVRFRVRVVQVFQPFAGGRVLKVHPFEKRGGWEGVSEALTNLKAGKASAVKYVFETGNSASRGWNW